jgi:hypothetical protein
VSSAALTAARTAPTATKADDPNATVDEAAALQRTAAEVA